MTKEEVIGQLQSTIKNKNTFKLDDYFNISTAFLDYIQAVKPTRIVSPFPRNRHYIFYQYGSEYNHKITRPLNTNLFFESQEDFKQAFERFVDFLSDLKRYQEKINDLPHTSAYLASKEIDKVIYTMQQVIGCVFSK